jgi:hypothetical protein
MFYKRLGGVAACQNRKSDRHVGGQHVLQELSCLRAVTTTSPGARQPVCTRVSAACALPEDFWAMAAVVPNNKMAPCTSARVSLNVKRHSNGGDSFLCMEHL